MTAPPRAVIVHRRTELDQLLARHGTRGQVEFFLATRGRTVAELDERHARVTGALQEVTAGVPVTWRRAIVERSDIARFPFEPTDTVIVVGQDGLVANVAKYLERQPVLGVDPEPGRNAGVLVTLTARQAVGLLPRVAAESVQALELTMVTANTDDGQQLRALNEVYVGMPTHQTARYTLQVDGRRERQASSGVLVGTGVGASGWCASVRHDRGGGPVPGPTEAALAWFVREAWPSPATGVSMTSGRLAEQPLQLRVESDALVAFGDGLEDDALTVRWGQTVTLQRSPQTLRLVVGG